MGIRILDGDDGAVFYDSVSMTAFGPVMDDREQAELFQEWHKKNCNYCVKADDPLRLRAHYDKFRKHAKQCSECQEWTVDGDLCEDCEQAKMEHDIRMTDEPRYAMDRRMSQRLRDIDRYGIDEE